MFSQLPHHFFLSPDYLNSNVLYFKIFNFILITLFLLLLFYCVIKINKGAMERWFFTIFLGLAFFGNCKKLQNFIHLKNMALKYKDHPWIKVTEEGIHILEKNIFLAWSRIEKIYVDEHSDIKIRGGRSRPTYTLEIIYNENPRYFPEKISIDEKLNTSFDQIAYIMNNYLNKYKKLHQQS